MTDYSKTIIYKIQHETKLDLLYVGHTIEFSRRQTYHKSQVKMNTKKLYQMIRDNGGWESFKMTPIMEFPCENKIQACIQEEKCRIELNANMNTISAINNPEKQKETSRKYKKEHHEEILEKGKIYYQNHKEERKAYRESIAEEQKEYKKEWRAKNKDKINQRLLKKIMCTCGVEYTFCNKIRHEKTKFHINKLK